MDLSKILSVSGMSGLFKIIAQGKSGLIVESLSDKKRMPVHASSKVSVLDNISMYLSDGNTISVQDVLKKIYEKQGGLEALDPKSSPDDVLVKFFSEIIPGYDKEKVHISDMRKAILWYNILQKTDIFTQKDEAEKDKQSVPVIKDENEKNFRDLGQINQGKHLNTAANVPKKTIGVRKTGTA